MKKFFFLKYTEMHILVGGLEFNGKDNLRITVEGYYKNIKLSFSHSEIRFL